MNNKMRINKVNLKIKPIVLTISYRFLSFSAIASYLDLVDGSTSDHFLPNSLAISPTPYSGFKAFTFVRSSLQNQKKADLKTTKQNEYEYQLTTNLKRNISKQKKHLQ